jgi:hypothetical protein
MRPGIPDFKARHAEQRSRLTERAIDQLLERGRRWPLGETLKRGGAVIFPHIGIEIGGSHAAASIDGILRCGADTVLVVGVLHALTEELESARRAVADGGAPDHHPAWGIQGPGQPGREDWRDEFSLDHFLFLWKEAVRRSGKSEPKLVARFPFLAGGKPDRLPGIGELEDLVAGGAVLVATGDLCHHGIGYGDPPGRALSPEPRGLEMARELIETGLTLLASGDHPAYQAHSVRSKSDARDVGQVLRHLIGPLHGTIRDLVWEDMASAYGKPPPTWVAGALVELEKRETPASGRHGNNWNVRGNDD